MITAAPERAEPWRAWLEERSATQPRDLVELGDEFFAALAHRIDRAWSTWLRLWGADGAPDRHCHAVALRDLLSVHDLRADVDPADPTTGELFGAWRCEIVADVPIGSIRRKAS